MAYIHIMAYSGLKPMPNVSVHPDGYMVDEHGDVIKQAICPIPGDMSNRLFDGLTPGMVYSFESGMRLDMCTLDQRLNFMEALAEFAGYKPIREPGTWMQHPYTQGAHARAGGRFWELITLTTNRAILGPVVANKLLKEFVDDMQKAEAFDKEHDFEGGFCEQFRCWGKVFKMASQRGLISIY